MSKAEIIAELAQLSPEDLADVQSFLDRLTQQRVIAKPAAVAERAPLLRSPRLADHTTSADLKKQIIAD
jgi:hypothetical protein